MKLANFPKTFGMTELAKGYFPHLFNTAMNQTYIGPIPPKAFYYPEILKYYRSDVDILRRCCMECRAMFRSVTDIDPFEKCLTIVSACNLVFRKKFLRESTIVWEREIPL